MSVSDKDLMQLVGDGVEMLDAMKNRRIDREGVIEKFGVGPERVVDVQALAGDSVDNVPGAPGIGIKTAALLINEFGSISRSLLDRAEEIKQPKRRQTLIEKRAPDRTFARNWCNWTARRRSTFGLDDLEVRDPDPEVADRPSSPRWSFAPCPSASPIKLGVEAPVIADAPPPETSDAVGGRAGFRRGRRI